jgi:hypothetical protein
MSVDTLQPTFYFLGAKTVRFAPNENSGIFVAGEQGRRWGVSLAPDFRD